jgi:dTDP-4-dehydrorhamnose reductase
MRILLTGVTGQVGGALLPRLGDHDLIATSRATLDLSKPEQLAEALDRLAPELIINPAAYTAVDKAEDEHDLAHLINAVAPGAIARWAASHNVPFIHFSTDYVFDGSGRRPWREDDPTGPLSAYGASKLRGETALRAAGGVFLIIRTSWIYDATGANFLRTVTRLARERKELRIIADQVGAPTSANLIAEIVSGLVGNGLTPFRKCCEQASGLVHLSAAHETSWYGFANTIVEGLKTRGVALAVEHIHPITSEEYPARAKRPHNSRLDLSRVRNVFGVRPQTWRDALSLELDVVAQAMR